MSMMDIDKVDLPKGRFSRGAVASLYLQYLIK